MAQQNVAQPAPAPAALWMHQLPDYACISDLGNRRKRLLPVVRYFSGPDSQFYLSAAYMKPKRSHNPSIHRGWNPLDTTYFMPNQYFNRLLQKDPYFRQFQVIIPSLMYIGRHLASPLAAASSNVLHAHINTSIVQFIRKQLGGHLFVRRQGYIFTTIAWNRFEGGNFHYRILNTAGISSIYPVHRYEFQNPPGQRQRAFMLGLEYRRVMAPNYNEGNRYYHRRSDRLLRAGGAYELPFQRLQHLTNGMPQGYTNSVTFYVCAGAKLCVLDNCNQVYTQYNHNRTYIQQGGVFVNFCDSKLRIIIPHEEIRPNVVRHLVYTNINQGMMRLTWDQFVPMLRTTNNFFDSAELSVPSQLELTQPNHLVLFLGANYSEYNSVCWVVDLDQDQIPSLNIPEGGRIAAISHGTEGFQEVVDRIQYEFLHDSVVTDHGIAFAVPPEDPNAPNDSYERIIKILNFDDQRSFIYRFGTYEYTDTFGVQQQVNIEGIDRDEKRPVFPEFNFRYLTDEISIDDFSNNPLPVPPMYPPLILLEQGTYVVHHLPNTTHVDGLAVRGDLRKVYPLDRRNHLLPDTDPSSQIYTFKNGLQCRLGFGDLQDQHWQRIKDPNVQFDANEIDDINHRIGVDGWLWQKSTQLQTGAYKTLYYGI